MGMGPGRERKQDEEGGRNGARRGMENGNGERKRTEMG